jgi:predicted phage terminase large subunit-like protein
MTSLKFHGKHLTLYNLATAALGYDKVTSKHRDIWCNPLEKNVKRYNRHLYLKPRGTYKSTLYTVSYTINLLIDDFFDNNGKFTKRILIASATNELAQQFVGEITQHLLDNERVHEIFGYKPVRRSNQQEVWLYPRVVKKEPNIKAKGALSGITSEHYDVIICDDIVSAEDRESETIREKKKRWLQDLISILEPDGLLIVIGTRWHSDDLYQLIIDNNEKLPERDKYHIEVEAVIDENNNLLFPTIVDHDKIISLKIEKGLVEFYSQYMNNPLPSETQLFSVERMMFYSESAASLEKEYNFAYMDPALGSIAKGKGDYIVVLYGARKGGRIYIRDCIITNTKTPDAVINDMYDLYKFYDCTYVGVESNGFQTLFAKSVREKGMIVKEVRSNKPKEIRIESIEPAVASGKVMFRDDWKTFYLILIEQMIVYPVGKRDDVPDAVHGLLKTGLKLLSGVSKEKIGKLVKTNLLTGRRSGKRRKGKWQN